MTRTKTTNSLNLKSFLGPDDPSRWKGLSYNEQRRVGRSKVELRERFGVGELVIARKSHYNKLSLLGASADGQGFPLSENLGTVFRSANRAKSPEVELRRKTGEPHISYRWWKPVDRPPRMQGVDPKFYVMCVVEEVMRATRRQMSPEWKLDHDLKWMVVTPNLSSGAFYIVHAIYALEDADILLVDDDDATSATT